MKTQHYADDGYIYENGKRTKKWFISKRGWNHYWEPATRDIIKLEALYQKLVKRETRRWDRISELLEEIYKQAPLYEDVVSESSKDYKRYRCGKRILHAVPLHSYEGDKNHLWLYEIGYTDIYMNGTKMLGCSFDWVETPKEQILPELGSALYHLEFHSKPYFLFPIKEVLEKRLHSYVRDKCDPPSMKYFSRTYNIKINDRTYWFEGMWNKYATRVEIKTLHWPENDTFFGEVK